MNWKECLGRKVSVRYRLHGDPEHPFSEAIGVVASVTTDRGTDSVMIVNRRGVATQISAVDVLAAKLFPL